MKALETSEGTFINEGQKEIVREILISHYSHYRFIKEYDCSGMHVRETMVMISEWLFNDLSTCGILNSESTHREKMKTACLTYDIQGIYANLTAIVEMYGFRLNDIYGNN